MATTQRRTGAGLNPSQPVEDNNTISMTKDELNAMIASAVAAAVNAAGMSPARPVSPAPTRNRTMELETDFNNRMKANDGLGMYLNNEEKVEFSIPQIYQQYVPTITASINGQTIKIPADGVKRAIPKSYIPIIQQYLENVDNKVAAMQATQGQYGGIAEIKGGAL